MHIHSRMTQDCADYLKACSQAIYCYCLILHLHWANVTYWYGSVRFGTVINYSVNSCTNVPYRTEPYTVGSLASVGLVRYGTVQYGRQWRCKQLFRHLWAEVKQRAHTSSHIWSILYLVFYIVEFSLINT